MTRDIELIISDDNGEMLGNENKFDLLVLGTGTAASVAAHECRSAGLSVAIIDSLPFGGTCALRGCEPKKILVEAAKVIDSVNRHEKKGITGSQGIHVKWAELMSFKRTFTEPFPQDRENSYVKSGIVPFHGQAKFIGTNTVKVERDDNGNGLDLSGKYILIATGAKPYEIKKINSDYFEEE